MGGCKVIVVGGMQAGVGKSTVTVGLMAALRQRGLRVQGFKVGPDLLDPLLHEAATGKPSYNLDGWMLTKEHNLSVAQRLAGDADVAVVEGGDGLYDGTFGDEGGSTGQLAKWLRASHSVGDAAVALRALTHARLIDESRHKGQWWLPEAAGTEAWFAARAAQGALDKQASSTAAAAAAQEGAELLQKAKGLRMNTEARRAIFCVVMGSEDFADALDRLLKLPLADKQEREIPRVLIECCLQEKAYNPYYEVLATRLCERVKGHRLTLQLCVWDQIREVAPTNKNLDGFDRKLDSSADEPKVSVRRIANLARFTAGLLVSGALAPGALKVIDFGGAMDTGERSPLLRTTEDDRGEGARPPRSRPSQRPRDVPRASQPTSSHLRRLTAPASSLFPTSRSTQARLAVAGSRA